MATRNRIRSESSTRLTEYSGTGSEMCPTDPNTLRDCLKYGIYLGDEPHPSTTTPTAIFFRKSSSKSSSEVGQRSSFSLRHYCRQDDLGETASAVRESPQNIQEASELQTKHMSNILGATGQTFWRHKVPLPNPLMSRSDLPWLLGLQQRSATHLPPPPSWHITCTCSRK